MPTFIKGDKHKCFILGEDTETFGPGQKMEFLPPHGFLAELRLDFVMSPAGDPLQERTHPDGDLRL